MRRSMQVEDFKFIYWMEWAHRMWGRTLGLVFIVPAVYFAARGAVKGPLAARLGLLGAMGGAQGLVGWWMVRSGLQVSCLCFVVPTSADQTQKCLCSDCCSSCEAVKIIFFGPIDSCARQDRLKMCPHAAQCGQMRWSILPVLCAKQSYVKCGSVACTRSLWSFLQESMSGLPSSQHPCSDATHLNFDLGTQKTTVKYILAC